MEKQKIRKMLVIYYFGSLKCPKCGHQHFNSLKTIEQFNAKEINCDYCQTPIEFEIVDDMDEFHDTTLYHELKEDY
jgi:transcription elongation factor Elf1